MLINSEEFGRIEVRDIPLPWEGNDISGTYTYSGRVLVSYCTSKEHEGKDWYHVVTINDDGTDLREVFDGEIPRQQGANGIRWMCFPDNQRILLGDYILECSPDIDHCKEGKLVRLYYPEHLAKGDNIFFHWSEIIVAPDNMHMCWTMLTMSGSRNYLGRLKKEADAYYLENVCAISDDRVCEPDPVHEGYDIMLPARGGELKQFIRGGRAVTMAGGGNSVSESMILPLDSEELIQITDTPGYEETTIFSADERLGVVMSPRFSEKTSCAVFGLVPQPQSIPVRGKLINCLYMYCVSGVRAFRKGNVGPVLIDIEKSCREGRAYKGVNLSDPEGRYVYYSPISWHPDSTRAMWNESTRMTEGERKSRLRMCQLLDWKASEPVPAGVTPEADKIPYSHPGEVPRRNETDDRFSIKIKGKHSGYVVNESVEEDSPVYYRTVYHNFSDDGKTFYNGSMKVNAPASIFSPGRTVFEADLSVTGEHSGEMKLRAVFRRDDVHAPAMLSFAEGEDGKTESCGYSTYDGVTLDIKDMEP